MMALGIQFVREPKQEPNWTLAFAIRYGNRFDLI
jgi:hypothetical protein